MKNLISYTAIVALLTLSTGINAGSYDKKIKKLLSSDVANWISDPMLIKAVKQQNSKHATLTQREVDSLDKQWRAEKKSGGGPKIDSVLNNSLSQFLKKMADRSEGLYTEMFVMDNKGLNVGQNKVTSDYWQGDEDKWQKTYLSGSNALFIDEIEYDDSAKRFQIQVSVPVVDPETKGNIGAVTIGLAMRKLVRQF